MQTTPRVHPGWNVSRETPLLSSDEAKVEPLERSSPRPKPRRPRFHHHVGWTKKVLTHGETPAETVARRRASHGHLDQVPVEPIELGKKQGYANCGKRRSSTMDR